MLSLVSLNFVSSFVVASEVVASSSNRLDERNPGGGNSMNSSDALGYLTAELRRVEKSTTDNANGIDMTELQSLLRDLVEV